MPVVTILLQCYVAQCSKNLFDAARLRVKDADTPVAQCYESDLGVITLYKIGLSSCFCNQNIISSRALSPVSEGLVGDRASYDGDSSTR